MNSIYSKKKNRFRYIKLNYKNIEKHLFYKKNHSIIYFQINTNKWKSI